MGTYINSYITFMGSSKNTIQSLQTGGISGSGIASLCEVQLIN
ncbi:MAG: hypothetical protein K0R72_1122 [Clostridia bacterium]|jgi:hypothetical protein|nr:hypothetical protein [Clostridia bacterium]